MRKEELEDYQKYRLTLDGEESLIDKISPILKKLIQCLLDLPVNESKSNILNCFKKCMLSINDFEDEIETVERESILEAFYDLGKIVGLDAASEFAEAWRGDW
ncbi:hypothetical protein [Pseudomonas yamanorum]